MKIKPSDFRVRPGRKVKLKKWPTRITACYRSRQHGARLLTGAVAELSRLQELLYADRRHALLLIFQGMDAAGKDSAVKHVMSGVNPQGCVVSSFKEPSAEELAHDFLWRTVCRLPARGQIGIFNRSYYEEVLIVRVHPELLRRQGLPPRAPDRASIWEGRYRSIVDLEKHLHRNGTRVLKFYLHLSKGEQRRRFLARIDEPAKNWKFSLADIAERRRWDDYQDAYADCLAATSTEAAPWYVVPADDKLNARLIISRIICDELAGLGLTFPRVSARQRTELRAARRLLVR